jgi:hypothetical protein
MKKYKKDIELDGEILKIKDFLHDEFSKDDIRFNITSTSVMIMGASLSEKSEILDFKFNFYKIFNKKIVDFNSTTNNMPNITFNYS